MINSKFLCYGLRQTLSLSCNSAVNGQYGS